MAFEVVEVNQAAFQELQLPGSISAVSDEAALHRPLSDFVEAMLQAAGASRHTRRAYQTAVGLFIQYIDQERGERLPPEAAKAWRPFATTVRRGRTTTWEFSPPSVILRVFVDAALVDGFRAWRLDEGDTANTVSARIAAVRTFLSVCYRDGVLTHDQARALDVKPYRTKQKRDRKPVGRRLSAEEARILRGTIDTTSTKGKRDLALIDTMLFLGLRRDEVATLPLSSFRQSKERWWLHVTGKGSKTRRLKVPMLLQESIEGWLRAACLDYHQDGLVFRSITRGDRVTGNPVTASMIGQIVAKYGHQAGLAPLRGSRRLSPHDLRRTAARNAYDNGAPLLLVQAMLGHANVETTAHYIGAFDEEEQTATDFVKY